MNQKTPKIAIVPFNYGQTLLAWVCDGKTPSCGMAAAFKTFDTAHKDALAHKALFHKDENRVIAAYATIAPAGWK